MNKKLKLILSLLLIITLAIPITTRAAKTSVIKLERTSFTIQRDGKKGCGLIGRWRM